MEYFKIFNSCKIVKGASQALIYDLDRVDNSSLIPLDLFDILTEHKDKSIKQIKSFYQNQYDSTIDDYFRFLEEREFLFYCSEIEKESFPEREFNWNKPNKINNSIIDFDRTISISEYLPFILDLSSNNCQVVEIRSFVRLTLDEIRSFVKHFDYTSILTVELLSMFNEKVKKSEIVELLDEFPRLKKISFYASDFSETNGVINYSTNKVVPDLDCGNVDPKYFSINLDTFSEAQKHNTCLNCKVSLNKVGQIKNCPSMDKTFGDFRKVSIQNVLDKNEIKEDWNISKDEIEICKDCEYRYACTDCRAFTDEKSNKYSRPSRCNYNPYQGMWKGENGYIDVTKRIK